MSTPKSIRDYLRKHERTKMQTQLRPEIMTALEREQQTIRMANAEIASLQRGGISVKARRTVQGIELEIERPAWRKGHVSRSWRIIPWA